MLNMEKIKNKILSYINKYSLLLLYIIMNILSVTMVQVLTIGVITIRSLVGNLLVLLILGLIGLVFKEKSQKRYYSFLTFIFAIICIANSMYYTFYTSYISISLISTTTQVLDVSDAISDNVFDFESLIYLVFPILFILIINLSKKYNYYFKNEKLDKRNCLVSATVLVVSVVVFIGSLSSIEISKFNKVWNRVYTLNNYGVLIYQFNDLNVNLFDFSKDKDDIYNDFEEFIISKDTNYSSEYSDIFKDKNVIMIHAESIENTVLYRSFNGVELTPTLNRLASEGLFFSNYYSTISSGTSSDAEFMLNTSLLPATTGTAFWNYTNNEYVTLTSLLKDNGYSTFSMHANNGTFWNRNIMHTTLGYDIMYDKDYFEIDEVIGLGLSDRSFFNQSIDIILDEKSNNEKFFTNLITLSNHTPFNELDKYGDLDLSYTNELGEVVDYLEGTKIGDYFKSVHYFDTVLGEFLTSLEDNNLLEDTVIILYGDHDNLYNKEEYEILYNYDFETGSMKNSSDSTFVKYDEYDNIIDKSIPLIVWTLDGLYQEEITTPMSTIDILPTIGNMLGIYNKFALGNDVMSIDNNIVIFKDGSWLDNNYYYDAAFDKVILLNEVSANDEYIYEVNEYVDNLMTVSDNIIKYDLIREWGIINEEWE